VVVRQSTATVHDTRLGVSGESNQRKLSDNNRKEPGMREKGSKIIIIRAEILREEDDAAVIEK